MKPRRHVTREELQAKMAEVRDLAFKRLLERAETDPEAQAAVEKLRKQGYLPDA